MPRKPSKPSQARSEETKARILQKAREIFAERGFSGAIIRDIAAEAGATHSMVIYHFGSKEQLWREAVRDMFRVLDEEVVVMLEEEAELPLVERFRRVTRRYVRYCAKHPEHARITISETIRGGERLAWMIDEFVTKNHEGVLPMLAQLMDEGHLPRMPVPAMLYAYVGMTQMPFLLAAESRLATGYDPMDDAAIDAYAESVLGLTLRP
ncbi:TetR/AcrR family transcriptional regulator [Croceicoccus gelatinilyticus]|uniref:TetR/AcrR family transcriptional regulator n=1 Tax=Croceicoccus gelatinilyticus TaxID=2835536 RepID=UPI001BCD6FB8|nr:TetR/AcrR family transcriptional regulator [Croceicoccus gelatinilyticus]MBS7671173.1 TetR/AcrR family transcriptional regulator [Croceicoccus gelatinilyticus]